MDRDLIRLLLLAVFAGLFASAAVPAVAVPPRRGYRAGTSRSSNSDAAVAGPSPLPPLREELSAEQSDGAVFVLEDTEARPAQCGRSRRTWGR